MSRPTLFFDLDGTLIDSEPGILGGIAHTLDALGHPPQSREALLPWIGPPLHDSFEALFGGVGKPEVWAYGSHYLSGFLNDKPLVRLRSDLAALGLGRDESRAETEDHIAYLCEVMRYLIAGDDVAVANLTQQQRFFAAHLQPWVERLCEAIGAQPRAEFYRAVALFTQAFMNVEAQGFDLVE